MQELGEWEEGNFTAALDKNLLSRFVNEHSTTPGAIFLKIKQHNSQRPNYTYSGLKRFTGTTGNLFTVWQKLLFRRGSNWNYSSLTFCQLRVRYKYTMAQLYLTENSYRNSRVFGDKFVTEFGESLNLVRCSVKISVTILVFHQNRWWFQWQFWLLHQI